MTEQELVAAARSGDPDAFARLVEANQTKVYNLAYRMTGNPEDAADLTQEAFLNAWRGLARFGGQSAFSTWLYRLTSNACIDFLRRQGRRETLSMTVEENGDVARQAEWPDERWSPERGAGAPGGKRGPGGRAGRTLSRPPASASAAGAGGAELF